MHMGFWIKQDVCLIANLTLSSRAVKVVIYAPSQIEI